MSLLQWLTVGRSFKDTQEKPSRYKMTSLNLVPNFGAENRKNPASGPAPATSQASGGGKDRRNFETSTPLFIEREGGHLTLTSTIDQASANTEAEIQIDQSAKEASSNASRRYPKGRWTMIRNPWNRPAKPAIPPESKQGELTLED